MAKRIYLSSPHMSDEGYEMKYIQEAFDTNWIAPLGKNVDEFEKELAAYVGIGHAAALSSGTAAMHMALKAAGVDEGDIVFCQSLTFSGTANPIIYQNAIPVFIDSDYETWNMCPKALEEAFEKYPRVKAVIVVHLYGLSADMDKIVELCKEHNVTLIEDAAESLGTKYKGKHTGTIGDYGIYIFNGNKIITTSGGGMLVSNNKERIDKVRFWSRVVGRGEQLLAQLGHEVAHEGPLVRAQLDLVAPRPSAPGPVAVEQHGQSCCIVAQSPCSCSRNTSSSAFSRVPLDTTARPS